MAALAERQLPRSALCSSILFCVFFSEHSPSSLFSSSLYSLGVTPLLLLLSGNLSSGSSGGGEFGDKSVGSWGVLGKPKARRRSTGLLRRAVIILVTCYRRACSSVYLQLLLPLGAHFNAWGWLLCNEFRNTGSRCKKRRETREARNHWPITDRSARKKPRKNRKRWW